MIFFCWGLGCMRNRDYQSMIFGKKIFHVLCLSCVSVINSNSSHALIKLDTSYVYVAKWCFPFEFEHRCSIYLMILHLWLSQLTIFASVCLFFDSQLTQSACFPLEQIWKRRNIFCVAQSLIFGLQEVMNKMFERK